MQYTRGAYITTNPYPLEKALSDPTCKSSPAFSCRTCCLTLRESHLRAVGSHAHRILQEPKQIMLLLANVLPLPNPAIHQNTLVWLHSISSAGSTAHGTLCVGVSFCKAIKVVPGWISYTRQNNPTEQEGGMLGPNRTQNMQVE